jgi:hypothetical protein
VSYNDEALGRIEEKIDSLVERLFNGGTGLINIMQNDHKFIEDKVSSLEASQNVQRGFIRAMIIIGGILWSAVTFILTYHMSHGGK